MFGAGYGCQNMVYLTISTGIGGGVIVNGRIMGGTSGTAGELGHMTVDWRGERCNCGNVGCLESIASGTAIARRANDAIARGAYFPLVATSQSEDGFSALEPSASALQEHNTLESSNHQHLVDTQAVA